MSKIKFPSKQDTENMKSIIEMLGDSVRRQCENREIASVLLYFQVVILDRCTLDDAISRFTIDVRPFCEDKGREQWYEGEEYTLVPRRCALEVTTEQSIAFAEKAVSVIQKIAERIFR